MDEILTMNNVTAGYQSTTVLEQITIGLRANTVTALLGRNGAGKTTLLSTIMGFTRVESGAVLFNGDDITLLPTHLRAKHGIALVPQEREIFPSLTVEENLRVARARRSEWTIAGVYELFPRLAERKENYGNQLSGGEQQMLAIGRALVSGPSLLLLDEPFEGLAPVIVDSLVSALNAIRHSSRISMILVEHHVDLALSMSDYVLILDKGSIIARGLSEEFRDGEKVASMIGLRELSSDVNVGQLGHSTL